MSKMKYQIRPSSKFKKEMILKRAEKLRQSYVRDDRLKK